MLAGGDRVRRRARRWALDPHRSLTQYSRTSDSGDGLPQDTIKAIVQTADGYLWLEPTKGWRGLTGTSSPLRQKPRRPAVEFHHRAAATRMGIVIGTASG